MKPAWIQPGEEQSSVLLHVPHSSRQIPDEVRADIRLSDHALTRELDAMTDRHTAELAMALADAMSVRPWLAVNPWSRLVIDPERFLDEREEMNQVGLGAVYQRTSDGQVLREPDLVRDEHLLDAYFRPYARGLNAATSDILKRHGQVLIVDVHSFPLEPLPYELHKDERRPEVCFGADDLHSPKDLVEAVRSAVSGSFTTAVNEPFHGCYIPDLYYGVNPQVQGLMIELRRDVGDVAGRLDSLASALGATLDAVTGF